MEGRLKYHNIYVMCIDKRVFPSFLTNADVTPIHKMWSLHDKENFRPVSVLPCISMIFESVLTDQLQSNFSSLFSENISGLRKSHSCHTILLKHVNKTWMRNNKLSAYSQTCLKLLFVCHMAYLLVNLWHIMFITTVVHCWSVIYASDSKGWRSVM